MNKTILSSQQILWDFKPKLLKVNNEDLKNHILKHNNPEYNEFFDPQKKYIELEYNQQLQWLRDWFSEDINLNNDMFIVHLKTEALIIEPNEGIDLHNDIDNWNLPTQPDITGYYLVSQGKQKSNCIIEYNNNRFKDKKWNIPFEDNKIIMFNSTLNRKITVNRNNEKMIVLVFKYQFLS